jgi:hypothetical protein
MRCCIRTTEDSQENIKTYNKHEFINIKQDWPWFLERMFDRVGGGTHVFLLIILIGLN